MNRRDEFLQREKAAVAQFAADGMNLHKRSYTCETCDYKTDSPEEAYDHVCTKEKKNDK